MEKEVAKYLDQGMSKDEILAAFEEKYGAAVLSAPPARGAFNLSAWVMPFAALLAGGLAVIFVLRRWKPAASARPQTAPPSDASQFRDRLEEELQKFNPED